MTNFETTMADFAAHIFQKAKAETCDIQDSIKAFDALTKYYVILTKGEEKGDKEPSRRPTTMAGMREKIARLSVVPERGEPDDDSA